MKSGKRQMKEPSSSSSCHAISTDVSDPFSPPLPMIHFFWHVFRATSSIGRELLYVFSSWTSYFCLSLRRGSQEYITYELVPTSPAVSCMSGSSYFHSFLWRVVGGRRFAVFWGAVSWTCSVLLAAFSCNCRQASFLYVLLASTCRIHILPLLGRNCAMLGRKKICKYLSILKADTFKQEEIKENEKKRCCIVVKKKYTVK